MSDITCPYCGCEQGVCHDDGFGYEEGEAHEVECGSCEKRFQFFTTISFSYEVHKADCLNTGEHEYVPTRTYLPQYARLRCRHCDDEKPMEKEKAQ